MTRPSSTLRPFPPTNRITSTRVEHVLGMVLGFCGREIFWLSLKALNLMASITISFAEGDRCTSSAVSMCSTSALVGNSGSRTSCSNLVKWMPRSLRSCSVHLTRLSNTFSERKTNLSKSNTSEYFSSRFLIGQIGNQKQSRI